MRVKNANARRQPRPPASTTIIIIAVVCLAAFALTGCGPVISDDLADSVYKLHGGNVLMGEYLMGYMQTDPAWPAILELRRKFPDDEQFASEIEKQPALAAFSIKLETMIRHLAHSGAIDKYVKTIMKKAGD